MSQAYAESIDYSKYNNEIAVISITTKSEHDAKINNETILRLQFDDMDEDISDSEIEYVLFNNNHCEKILNFIKNMPKNIRIIIVHCHAGISRSAAVAKFLANYYVDESFNHSYTLYNKLVYSALVNYYFEINGENVEQY
jgi:predicted protein tyrosine phosphatase